MLPFQYKYIYTKWNYQKRALFVCLLQTEDVNGTVPFVFLGRQTINDNRRLLFQQTCLSMSAGCLVLLFLFLRGIFGGVGGRSFAELQIRRLCGGRRGLLWGGRILQSLHCVYISLRPLILQRSFFSLRTLRTRKGRRTLCLDYLRKKEYFLNYLDKKTSSLISGRRYMYFLNYLQMRSIRKKYTSVLSS